MGIDWTLRLSDVLVVLGFAGTAGILLFRAGGFVKALGYLQKQITDLQSATNGIALAIAQMAIQAKEIEWLRRDVDDLRRGRGYIRDQRPALDGEYDRDGSR